MESRTGTGLTGKRITTEGEESLNIRNLRLFAIAMTKVV